MSEQEQEKGFTKGQLSDLLAQDGKRITRKRLDHFLRWPNLWDGEGPWEFMKCAAVGELYAQGVLKVAPNHSPSCLEERKLVIPPNPRPEYFNIPVLVNPEIPLKGVLSWPRFQNKLRAPEKVEARDAEEMKRLYAGSPSGWQWIWVQDGLRYTTNSAYRGELRPWEREATLSELLWLVREYPAYATTAGGWFALCNLRAEVQFTKEEGNFKVRDSGCGCDDLWEVTVALPEKPDAP